MLAAAMRHHCAGRLDAASEAYLGELAARPDNAAARHLLGFLQLQRGDRLGAVSLIRQALATDPDIAEAHNHLGLALAALGQLDEAVAAYRRSIALKPDNAAAHNNLGNALVQLRQVDAAVAAYRHGIAVAAGQPALHNNLGNALAMSGRLTDAVLAYRQAVALNPAYAEAHNNLGLALGRLGRSEDAVASYRRAIAARPNYPEARNNLVRALIDAGGVSEATDDLRADIAQRPNDASALNSLGLVLMRSAQWAEAAATFRRAIALAPETPEIHNNLGLALAALGRPEDAIAAYRQAIALRPDLPEAHMGLALRLLSLGRFAEGFEEYRWRWKLGIPGLRLPPLSCPLWEGEALSGKTILVHCEQGYGDCIQFVRYLRPLAAMAGRVVVVAMRPLVRLFQSIPGIEVLSDVVRDDRRYDYHSPLLCLPRVFGTTLETIPADAPYLTPDPAQTARFATLLAGHAGALKIGVVWAGAARDENPTLKAIDRRRSLSLDQLAPLAGVPGLRFVSLQKGPAAGLASHPPAGMDLVDLTADIDDFADTAALIANLDLVISVDTSVVHLAGALNKPVWVLSRFDGCWRWFADRDDSPWYPTARIFRQRAPGAWDETIQRVAAALHDFSRSHAAAAAPAG